MQLLESKIQSRRATSVSLFGDWEDSWSILYGPVWEDEENS
jgi:hypothetical protein